MGTIIDVLDEFRTAGTVVILERNRAEEFGGFVVKTRRRYRTEQDARAAYDREIKQRAPRKKAEAKNK